VPFPPGSSEGAKNQRPSFAVGYPPLLGGLGHDYVEFFDPKGQEYRIPQHTHLIEEYWVLFKQLGLRLEELREPRIENWLVEQLPFLDGYQGLPLALILAASKGMS